MSVASETAVIEIGGRRVEVRAFTLDQLQRILPEFERIRTAPSDLSAHIRILAAATGMKVEEVGQLRTTLPELIATLPVIAQVSGLVTLGERSAAQKD